MHYALFQNLLFRWVCMILWMVCLLVCSQCISYPLVPAVCVCFKRPRESLSAQFQHNCNHHKAAAVSTCMHTRLLSLTHTFHRQILTENLSTLFSCYYTTFISSWTYCMPVKMCLLLQTCVLYSTCVPAFLSGLHCHNWFNCRCNCIKLCSVALPPQWIHY